jgi:uncharacterized membrane protein (DUF2068 family)
MAEKKRSSRSRGDSVLITIGIFHLVKAASMIALTLGAAHLFHKDVEAHVEHWLNILRIDPDNRFVGGLLTKLNLVHTKELKQLTALGAFYSALFLTQGIGLLLCQRWAEWLTVVATGLFIPLEIYEIVTDFGVWKLALFIINSAIVAFLIYRIRSKAS